jgi:hypothetical protein
MPGKEDVMLASLRTFMVALMITAVGLLGIPAAHAQDESVSSPSPEIFFNDSTPGAGPGWSIGMGDDNATWWSIVDRSPAGGQRHVIFLEQTNDNGSSMHVNSAGTVFLANYTVNIDRAGRMGINLFTVPPQGNLHIGGSATQDLFSGIGPDLVNGPAFNFGYSGQSFGRGSGFFNVRPDDFAVAPNPSLRFATANIQRMIIDNQGYVGIGVANPSAPIHLGSGAFVSVGGVWTNASSREYKQEIAPLAADAARDALDGLVPVTFAYTADPAERHVGFVAEDVPTLVATADRKGLSPMDIVAVLTRVVQEQQHIVRGQQAAIETQQQVVQDQQRIVQDQQAALAELRAELASLRQSVGQAR